LDEEVAALNDQVHSLNNRQQKLAELKRGAEIVLSIYAGRLAASDRMSAEERQDVYRRLGLPITINPGGIVRIEGYLVANFVPLPDQINSPSVELRGAWMGAMAENAVASLAEE
jgi:hypothetical protein